MTSRSAHLLALVALGMLVASGPAFAQTDYDYDNDRLIDITTLAQLNAMRWDLNGDGVVSSTDSTNYFTAFSNPASGMGCPSAGCNGYELLNNLDFDENNDGAITSADATYWNSGLGWEPIGSDANPASRYTGDFKGNGHTIDNLFINRSSTDVGLFGGISSTSRIETLGVTNANVSARKFVGILAGTSYGDIFACYTTGAVSGSDQQVGGVIGYMQTPQSQPGLHSSYSTASVTAPTYAGGLVGRLARGRIQYSYAAGAVSGAGFNGGLVGSINPANPSVSSATASYYDITTTGQTGDLRATAGYATADLQRPTGYTGIYAGWNTNIDGVMGNDDPWYFGATNQYPVLKYAGLDTTAQFALQPSIPTGVAVTSNGDTLYVHWRAASQATGYTVQWKSGMQSYDAARQATTTATRYKIALTSGTTYTVRVIASKTGVRDGTSGEVMRAPGLTNYDPDGDGLIAITTLAQLNAMRWDINGDGAIDSSATTADTTAYNAAFSGRDTDTAIRMGCFPGCTGYELLANLDFDENNDGEITSADATYWNSGAGWDPVGPYSGTFQGNNNTISHLFIDRGTRHNAGLFHAVEGNISGLGLLNVDVTGNDRVGALTGVQGGGGTISSCYVTGRVSGAKWGVGGLVGQSHRTMGTNRIVSSYANVSVSIPATVTSDGKAGGLVGYLRFQTEVVASYALGPVFVGHSSGVGGGLVGELASGSGVTASYSIGRVTGDCTKGGLVGTSAGTVVDSYWDTQESGIADDGDTAMPEGEPTADLQSVTSATGIYNVWDMLTIDASGTSDDAPWTFGAMDQYPVLKYAGMDTTVQFQLQPAIVTLALTPSTLSESGGMSTVTATLSHPSSAATTITVRPVAGAYTVGMDSTITIAAGSTANASDTVVITAVDNTQDAPNRDVDMSVVADNAQGSVVRLIEITIIDDDAPPRLSISSPSAVEGTALTFTVRLNAVSGKEVTVAYADAGTGTATSGTDYTALTAGTLTFAAGTTTTSQTIAVTVTDDSDDEQNETVEVTLSNAVNATFDGEATSLTGTGTIIDDDGASALSIGSPSVIEGVTGATLTFQVYLRPAHNTLQVTVAYADAGTGTATSGTDYTALTAGTLTFAVGDTIQTIAVTVTDDSDDEQNETVIVTLSSATNATISTADGTGTIIDDETPSANLDVDGDGRVRLFSDIILVIRYVLFFRNEALLRGNVIEPTATRTTAQEIEPYLDTLVNQNILDVDGDGDVRLFSDIILVIRYVLFFRNEALVRGNVIEPTATRTTTQAIEPYIRSLYPDSHFQ